MERRTFHALDALRGVAAIAVVFWHADSLVGPLRPAHGDLAVDLFFVMSGFVIAHAYEARLRVGLRAGKFIALRLIRLYPLYILGSIIGFATAAHGLGVTFAWPTAAWALAMLPSPSLEHGAALYPYNGVAWSLLLEIIVNVVYAFTWKRWTTNMLLAMIAGAAAVLIAAVLVHGDANFGWTWRNLPGGIARVFFGFPMGVLLYRLHETGIRMPRVNFVFIIVTTLIVLAWRPQHFGLAVDLLGVLIATPLLVAFAIRTDPPSALMRPTALLGAASYAVYAIHLPLLTALEMAAGENALAHWAPLSGLAFALVVVGLALAADRWFDGPARMRLAALLPVRRRRLAPRAA